jgi:hypothetical protein
MLQQILILVMFIAALTYILRLGYKSFFSKQSCASGCGKCGAVDFAKIEEQLKKKGI